MKRNILFSNKTGRALKTPVTVDMPEPRSGVEKALQEEVIEACMFKMPRLIPFAIESPAMMELAKHVFIHNSGSKGVFEGTVRQVRHFCMWSNKTPDSLVKECKNSDGSPDLKRIAETEQLIDEYAVYLQTRNIAPNTVVTSLRRIKCLFRSNHVKLQLYSHRPAMVIYECRAPTIEELRTAINCADLRERLIVSTLATSGIRSGTLCKLKYYHVKEDLERQKIPIQIKIEAEITKGKTHSYYTFLNRESAEYLAAYLQSRRAGSTHIPPETICDQTPIIRTRQRKAVTPISSLQLQRVVHKLYFKAGILTQKTGITRYDFNVHSLRKFFRTQMAFLGIDSKYVDYMMGHKTDTYFDAEIKGLEYLRHLYQKSGISIRKEDNLDEGKLAMIRDLIFQLGLSPDKVLNPQFQDPKRSFALQV